jgi:hypothetical protein
MMRQPVPRKRIYDLYWYFASERQATFERRAAGALPPWTDDPVLLTYKFCNVYRAADRVSQYLIRQVAYHTETDTTPEDRVFQIVAFRTFSKVETWETVQQLIGRYPTLDDLASCRFKAALDETRHRNGGLYTGAFILCATNAYGQARKHHNHVELFRHMFLHDRLAEEMLDARSLQDVYQLLHRYPLMGDFMSYQTAIDLNYSALVNFSENDFTKPGPGALRGIRKAFESLGDYTPDEVIHWMVDHQDDELARLGLQFNGLWGRPLHAIDCQGLFCELDKYCRIAAPELASARKRIKARFTPNNAPVPFFFPPKWSLNERLTQAAGFVERPSAGVGLW